MSVPEVFCAFDCKAQHRIAQLPPVFPRVPQRPLWFKLSPAPEQMQSVAMFLVDPKPSLLLRQRNRLLRSRTKIPIRTMQALIAGLGLKFSLRDPARSLKHAHLSLFQLRVVPLRPNCRVVLEIMKNQPFSPLSPG